MYDKQLLSTKVRRHRSWSEAAKPRSSARVPAACQNHNVVVRQVGGQRTKIEGHRRFPVSCRTYDAVDAPRIDHQAAVSMFPNVLQEPEHCATRPAVLPSDGAVPEHLAREKLVDAGRAGHEFCQIPIQKIENFQRQQDSRPVLGELVRDRAYQFRDFVRTVDLPKDDHPVLKLLQEIDVLDGRRHTASVRGVAVRPIHGRSHLNSATRSSGGREGSRRAYRRGRTLRRSEPRAWRTGGDGAVAGQVRGRLPAGGASGRPRSRWP